MSTIDSQTPVAVVLANAEAIRLVEAAAPEFAGSPMLAHMAEFPIGPLLQLILGKEDPRIEEILVGLSAFEDATALPLAEADTAPRADYESDDVPKGEAAVTLPGSVTTGERVEVVFVGPSHGNPFVDVELTVGFHLGDDTISVGGFYDGNGVYRARFRPPVPGDWTFTTASNARSLDGISGALAVAAGAGRGPIRASGRGFTYADGSPFVPLGTTAYAWTHQAPELQEETLASLAQSPFNKLRMCLFPKSFIYNSNEPEHFVFERTTSGEWDFSRFDPVYFADLESRLDQLAAIGIEGRPDPLPPVRPLGLRRHGSNNRRPIRVVRRAAALLVHQRLVVDGERIRAPDLQASSRLGTPRRCHPSQRSSRAPDLDPQLD